MSYGQLRLENCRPSNVSARAAHHGNGHSWRQIQREQALHGRIKRTLLTQRLTASLSGNQAAGGGRDGCRDREDSEECHAGSACYVAPHYIASRRMSDTQMRASMVKRRTICWTPTWNKDREGIGLEHLVLDERVADSIVLAFDDEHGPFRLTYRLAWDESWCVRQADLSVMTDRSSTIDPTEHRWQGSLAGRRWPDARQSRGLPRS